MPAGPGFELMSLRHYSLLVQTRVDNSVSQIISKTEGEIIHFYEYVVDES